MVELVKQPIDGSQFVKQHLRVVVVVVHGERVEVVEEEEELVDECEEVVVGVVEVVALL